MALKIKRKRKRSVSDWKKNSRIDRQRSKATNRLKRTNQRRTRLRNKKRTLPSEPDPFPRVPDHLKGTREAGLEAEAGTEDTEAPEDLGPGREGEVAAGLEDEEVEVAAGHAGGMTAGREDAGAGTVQGRRGKMKEVREGKEVAKERA